MPPQEEIRKLRELIIRSSSSSKEGHVPSALCVLDIMLVLYNDILRLDPKNPRSETRDRFVLSKGHASLGLYAVLAQKGFIPREALMDFCSFESILGGHPDRAKIPWVEASTGSLGHGFPIAVGIALGLKIKKSDAKVYTLIGDGECNEGTIWEGALLAADHELDNLCCIVDHNHSTDRALDVGDLKHKFESFGWHTLEINGHDHVAIAAAFRHAATVKGKPTAIIAQTIKGHGIKSMEGNPAWHHKSPAPAELDVLITEIYAHD